MTSATNKYSVVLVDGSGSHPDGSRVILKTSLETICLVDALIDLDCRMIDSGECQPYSWQVIATNPKMMESDEAGLSLLDLAVSRAQLNGLVEADAVRDRLVSHYNWSRAMAEHHFGGGKLCEICGREWAASNGVCAGCAEPHQSRNITFRLKLTQAEHAALRNMAEANGQTPAQYVRERIFGENR